MVIRRCFPPYLAFISNEGISFLFFLQFFLYIKYNATHVVLIDTISLCLSTNLKQFKKLSERKKLFRTKYIITFSITFPWFLPTGNDCNVIHFAIGSQRKIRSKKKKRKKKLSQSFDQEYQLSKYEFGKCFYYLFLFVVFDICCF